MKPRSIWTGHLRVSLLTIPVRLYCALNEADKISFNQLHKGCHQRLKQQLVCPIHGQVQRENTVKGYEIEKDRFVVVEPSEIESLKLETTHTIDLVQFVDENKLDRLLLETPYFLGPNGPVSEEAFSVFREALKRSRRVGVGQVVMSGRERIVALSPMGRGLLFTTLRYPAEVRPAADYFESVGESNLDRGQIELAMQLIQNKTAEFNPATFTDRYQTALLDLIKAKVKGAKPVQIQPAAAGTVISLIEALKQSVAKTDKVQILPLAVKPRKFRRALAA